MNSRLEAIFLAVVFVLIPLAVALTLKGCAAELQPQPRRIDPHESHRVYNL